jgi:hypothetical protein
MFVAANHLRRKFSGVALSFVQMLSTLLIVALFPIGKVEVCNAREAHEEQGSAHEVAGGHCRPIYNPFLQDKMVKNPCFLQDTFFFPCGISG